MVKQDNWYFNAQTIFLLVIVNRYATQAHRSFRFLSFFPYLEYFDMLFLTQERGKKKMCEKTLHVFEFLKRRLHLRD